MRKVEVFAVDCDIVVDLFGEFAGGGENEGAEAEGLRV